MAKAQRKRSTGSPPPAEPPPPRRITALALPPEQVEGFRKLLEAGRQYLERARRDEGKLADARKVIDRAIAIRDGVVPPPWLKRLGIEPAGTAAKPLPTRRPAGVGPKVWLAITVVAALWREGFRWTHQEILLRRVRKQIGDERLSLRTLKEALHWLRRRRLIDR